MKGTHWTGLILSIGMGCATKEAVEADAPSESTTYVDDSVAGQADEESEDGDQNAGQGNGSDTDENEGNPDDGDSNDGDSNDDVAAAEDNEELVLPSGLNGTRIDPPVPLIDFYAVNRDGTSRSTADLNDGPTVIWFYPAADTYG